MAQPSNAELNRNIDSIKKLVMPREEILLRFAQVERDVANTQKDIVMMKRDLVQYEEKMNKKTTYRIITTNILTAFLTASMAALITYFIQTSSR